MILKLLAGTTLCFALQVCADELTLISNPTGQIHVIDHNEAGTMILSKEIGSNGVFKSQYVVRKDAIESRLTTPEEYTAIHIYRLSNNGVVAGFCTRPGNGGQKYSMMAVTWNIKTRVATMLPCLGSFHGASAFDISGDGSIVSGYLIGSMPPRLVPCIWRKETDEWRCQKLPTPSDYNPFLVSSKVVISDNGKHAAAVCAVETDNRLQNRLMCWQLHDNGRWSGRKVGKEGYKLADINDHGTIAASRLVDGKSRAFVVRADGDTQLIEPFEGDVQTFALDLNNHGQVVGYSDDPRGPDGGPEGFLWQNGKARRIDFPFEVMYSSAYSINDTSQIGGFLIAQKEDEAITGAFLSAPINRKNKRP